MDETETNHHKLKQKSLQLGHFKDIEDQLFSCSALLKLFAQSRDEELSVEVTPDDDPEPEVWTEADMDDPVIVQVIRSAEPVEEVEEGCVRTLMLVAFILVNFC